MIRIEENDLDDGEESEEGGPAGHEGEAEDGLAIHNNDNAGALVGSL